MANEDNGLFTASEVAEIFRVDRRTVVRWAKRGKIEFMRTAGGHFRFPANAVKRLQKNTN